MENVNRKVAFQALVGSHNYGLNEKNSDRDYKLFVFPTFDDLYEGKMYSNSTVGEKEDYDCHDLRKLPELLKKANVNFLEVLFSKELLYQPTESYFMKPLMVMRDELASMNLSYLFNSTKGMHFRKRGTMLKATAGTQHLVDEYGYNTKDFLHAYRVLDFFDRFAQTNFTDFTAAMEYTPKEREKMLELKNGKYSYEEALELLDKKLSKHEEYGEAMKKKKFDEKTFERLSLLVKKEVRSNM